MCVVCLACAVRRVWFVVLSVASVYNKNEVRCLLLAAGCCDACRLSCVACLLIAVRGVLFALCGLFSLRCCSLFDLCCVLYVVCCLACNVCEWIFVMVGY